MNNDQVRTGMTKESGRSEEAMRNAEPPSGEERDRRREQPGRSRADQDDLLLHDDDEAELELPR